MKHQKNLSTWMGIILGAICALLLTAVSTHASDRPGQLTEEFHQTYPLASTGRVELENINGAVHISTWDRNEIKVDAVKSAYDQKRLDEAKIKIDSNPDSISIRTEYPYHDRTFNNHDWDNPASVEYTLTVPRTALLDEIKLINGSLDIQGAASTVHASSINGRLTASGLKGQTRLSTINGRLEARFEQTPNSVVELSSVNGSLSLTLPSDAKADLEASTVHGGINNDFGLRVNNHQFVGHDLNGQLGGGGTRIKLSNVNGRIEILHAGDGRALSPAKDRHSRDDDNDEI